MFLRPALAFEHHSVRPVPDGFGDDVLKILRNEGIEGYIEADGADSMRRHMRELVVEMVCKEIPLDLAALEFERAYLEQALEPTTATRAPQRAPWESTATPCPRSWILLPQWGRLVWWSAAGSRG